MTAVARQHGFSVLGGQAPEAMTARVSRSFSERLRSVCGVGREATLLDAFVVNVSTGLASAVPEFVSEGEPEDRFGWVEDIYSAVDSGERIRAADLLLDHVDDMLLEGAFELCNSLFHIIDPKRLDTHLLIGVLTATLPAAAELRDRPKFVVRAEAYLSKSESPDRVRQLLEGLG